MKGIVFTEFVNLVESKFGPDMMEDLFEATDPESGGAYSTVGTYNHEELVAMVVELSKRSDIPVPELIKTFGHHLAGVFTSKFGSFFEEVDNTLEFLKKIDNHIHVEVAKLYPDAELPVFAYDDSQPDRFVLDYSSTRGFADLAHGLIEATAGYYKETFDIEREDHNSGDQFQTRFILRKTD